MKIDIRPDYAIKFEDKIRCSINYLVSSDNDLLQHEKSGIIRLLSKKRIEDAIFKSLLTKAKIRIPLKRKSDIAILHKLFSYISLTCGVRFSLGKQGKNVFLRHNFNTGLISDSSIINIAIPTHNAPKTLKKTLTLLCENFKIYKHSAAAIYIFDDSTDDFFIQKNKEIIQQLMSSFPTKIKHITHDFRYKVFRLLKEFHFTATSGLETPDVFFEKCFMKTAGGNRNMIFSCFLKEKVILIDHDCLPGAFIDTQFFPKKAKSHKKIFHHKLIGKIHSHLRFVQTDFLSSFNRVLGVKAAEVIFPIKEAKNIAILNTHFKGSLTTPANETVTLVKSITTGDFDFAAMNNMHEHTLGVLPVTLISLNKNIKMDRFAPLSEIFLGQNHLMGVASSPIISNVITKGGRSETTTMLGVDLDQFHDFLPGLPTTLRFDDFSILAVNRCRNRQIKLALLPTFAGHERSNESSARKNILEITKNELIKDYFYTPLLRFLNSNETSLAKLLEFLKPANNENEILHITRSHLKILCMTLIEARALRSTLLQSQEGYHDETLRFLGDVFTASQEIFNVTGKDVSKQEDDIQFDQYLTDSALHFIKANQNFVDKEYEKFVSMLKNWDSLAENIRLKYDQIKSLMAEL